MLDEKVMQAITTDIRTRGYANQSKFIIQGHKGAFDAIREHLETGCNYNELFGFHMNRFMFAEVGYNLKKNKHEDKIQINDVVSFLGHSRMELFRKSDVDTLALRNRTMMVSALAFVGQFPGTKLSIYRERQQAKDRLLQVSHDDIYQWLHKRMTFTGDFMKDYEQSWLELWFNYETDMTGADTLIKRISLANYSKLLSKET